MKKIFISQPMNGLTDEEIKESKSEAIERLKKFMCGEEFEIIDSFFETAPHDAKPLWFIGKSIELMADADYVLFLYGWDEARGCRIEHICAQEYGVQAIYLHGDNSEEVQNGQR